MVEGSGSGAGGGLKRRVVPVSGTTAWVEKSVLRTAEGQIVVSVGETTAWGISRTRLQKANAEARLTASSVKPTR